MPSQHIIRFLSDGLQLTGTLHLPDTSKPSVVIGCHGLLADRRSPKQIALAEALNAIGIAYLRFDHRGCGDSQGDLNAVSLLASRCRDLYHAIDIMQSHSLVDSIAGLFGSSFGGTVAMAVAAQRTIPAVVTYAAPIHSRSIRQAVINKVQAQKAIRAAHPSDFSFDIRQLLGTLSNILIMHGQKDEIVPLTHARQIHRAAKAPKKLVVFAKGDHRMSNADHQQRFIRECVGWYKGKAAARLN